MPDTPPLSADEFVADLPVREAEGTIKDEEEEEEEEEEDGLVPRPGGAGRWWREMEDAEALLPLASSAEEGDKSDGTVARRAWYDAGKAAPPSLAFPCMAAISPAPLRLRWGLRLTVSECEERCEERGDSCGGGPS